MSARMIITILILVLVIIMFGPAQCKKLGIGTEVIPKNYNEYTIKDINYEQ